MENEMKTLSNNIAAARAAFDRALAAVNEISDRIEAAGGINTGHETAASDLLMSTFDARSARLVKAEKNLRHVRTHARLFTAFSQQAFPFAVGVAA